LKGESKSQDALRTEETQKAHEGLDLRLDEALDRFRQGKGFFLDDLLEDTEDREETLFRVLHPDYRPVKTLLPGMRIDDFVIQKKIGEGGMGIVYEAIEDRTGRKVALKVSRFEGEKSENRDQALQREMKALAKLLHPNIAVLYRAGFFEKRFTFLAMELVQGVNLRQYVREHDLGIREVLKVFLSLVEAVAFIESKGILHLDLKPSNILVNEKGQLKLLDFGLSKLQHMGLDSHDSNPQGQGKAPEKMAGTFPYLAPEQVRGQAEEFSTRTDVYQLGFILYELLLGRRPVEFLENERREMAKRILEEPIRDPRSLRKGFPKDLGLILLKCLEKKPKNRYSGAAALLQDLRAYLDGFPVQAREPSFGDLFGKFLKRNRRMALFYTLLFAVSGALGGVSLFSYWGAKKAQQKAEGLERSLAIISGAIRDLGPGGKSGTAKVMVGALAGIEKALDQDVGKGELLPAQEARLRAMLGRHYTKIGFHQRALPQLQMALRLRRKLYGAKPNADLAQSLRDLAFLYHAMSSYEKSEPLHREALAMRLALFSEASIPVCQSKEELAELLVARGRPLEALGLLREGLSLVEQAPGGGPVFLRQLRDLARLTADQGKSKEALTILKRGTAFIAGNPQEVGLEDRFFFLKVYAKVLAMDGQDHEAASTFDQVEGLCASLFGGESEEMARLLGLRVSFDLPGTQKETSLAKARRASRLGAKVYGEKHPITLNLRKVYCQQLFLHGMKKEGLAELLSLIQDYRSVGDGGKAGRNAFFIMASSRLLDHGEVKKAQELLDEVRPFFVQEGKSELATKIFFHLCVARLLYLRSQNLEAYREAEKGLILSARIPGTRFNLGVLGVMGLAQEAMGNKKKAQELFQRRERYCQKYGLRNFGLDRWRKKD